MRDEERLGPCLDYFKGKNGFDRMFREMEKKIKSLGHAGGKIILKAPSLEERLAVGGFLGRSFPEDEIAFSVREFSASLDESRFSGVSLEKLVEAYVGHDIRTGKELKKRKEEEEKLFYKQLYGTPGLGDTVKRWLSALSVQEANRLFAEWKKKDAYKDLLALLNRGLERAYDSRVAGKYIRLAVLASEISGKPHFLDRNKSAGKLFIRLLDFAREERPDSQLDEKEKETECADKVKENAEWILKLYLDSGIRPDDISSHVTIYGIGLWKEGHPVLAYEDFMERKESCVVTLSNLSQVDKAVPGNSRVYIIENQMVFSELCDRCPNASLVCTSGQLRTASLILLDLLCGTDAELYYAGDIDPEGMGIAQKVLERGKGRIQPLFMDRESYLANLSGDVISASRLLKLDSIRIPQLKETADALKEKKRPAYQESMLEEMIKRISEEEQ